MHAYASEDPIFLAMNRRGQRETGGELGDFCVKCHAPMALKLGLTTDGLNLESVPQHLQGITCYYCHSVDTVEGTHNNPLVLADDLVMRGSYRDPVKNKVHRSGYSPYLDRNDIRSASLCGACHDLVTPLGLHVERTFAEWKTSLYGNEDGGKVQTCGQCHTKGRDDVAAQAPGVVLRRVHNHQMVGVDVALKPFPQMAEQKARIVRELSFSVAALLCVYENDGLPDIEVSLENTGVGHSWPSGATQDRRAWVELITYDASGNVLFQTGVIADDEVVANVDDPHLWTLGTTAYDTEGVRTHKFWEMASMDGQLLPAPTAASPLDPNYTDIHLRRRFTYDGPMPAAASVRVLIRPMGLDVLDDLVESGDLDASYRMLMPTFELGFTKVQWNAEDRLDCAPVDHKDF
jgi:hypothetical protein